MCADGLLGLAAAEEEEEPSYKNRSGENTAADAYADF
jgi:hypothetical protein